MATPFPLTTDRLVIEPMRLADAAALAAYRTDPAVARFQSWEAPFPLDDAERMLRGNPAGWPPAGEWLQLAIRLEGALVGDVAVHPLDDPVRPDTVEVGVTVAPASQGRGIAFEALTAVLDACFADGTHRVLASCDARNATMAHVLTRLGMRHEAGFIDAEWWKGEWTTADTWAILAEEWLG